MDDFWGFGSSSGGDGGSWNMSDSSNFGSGGDTSGYNMPDYYGNTGSYNDYTGLGPGGDYSGSTNSGSMMQDFMKSDWSKYLAQAGLAAAGGYFSAEAANKLQENDYKYKTQLMKDTQAETEKYYQAHGKQLADAYGNYSKYYTPPSNHGPNNPTSLFGLLTPQTAAVQKVDGFAFDPTQQQPAYGSRDFSNGY